MITLVTMIWTGARGYTLAHAAAMLDAVARRTPAATYTPLVVSDQRPPTGFRYPVVPLPACAQRWASWQLNPRSDYPACLPKLWLFSAAAHQLGARLLWLDADALVIGDLAPILAVAEATPAPFLGMWLDHKLCGGMYALTTGALVHVWDRFVTEGAAVFAAHHCSPNDQGWMRYMGLASAPHWDNRALGIYSLKETDRPGATSPLPADARLVLPTGKTKPWHSRFLERYPWAQAVYVCPR